MMSITHGKFELNQLLRRFRTFISKKTGQYVHHGHVRKAVVKNSNYVLKTQMRSIILNYDS